MDRLLKNIEQYKKVIIVSDDISVDLSNMVYECIVGKFTDMVEFYRKARMLTYSPKYKYFDMFFEEDNHKNKYRKFYNGNVPNFVLRVKGGGYNIDGLGLDNSHAIFRGADLIIFVRDEQARVLGDLYNKDLRTCDTDIMYRSYKVSKILNKINDENISTDTRS